LRLRRAECLHTGRGKQIAENMSSMFVKQNCVIETFFKFPLARVIDFGLIIARVLTGAARENNLKNF
jgi:hypothetical protein